MRRAAETIDSSKRQLPAGRIQRMVAVLVRLLGSPVAPALVVALAYGLWIGSVLRSGHDLRDFVFIGRSFVSQSHSSSVIRFDPHYDYSAGSTGYDGQFSYFIALDPLHARDYLDDRTPGSAGPDYRYTRIVYPMLARLLASGRASAVPAALIAVNWLSLGFATLALGAWLRRRGSSPWLALVFGLYPGLFVAFQRDLTEPLAYAFVTLALYACELSHKRALWLGAACFALASLTRETTLVFPAVVAVSQWRTHGRSQDAERRRLGHRSDILLFSAISLLPFLFYKLFLLFWLGTVGRTGGVYPQPVPLGGLVAYWPWDNTIREQLPTVVIPGLVCLVGSIWLLRHLGSSVAAWLLLANVLLYVIFLNEKSYAEYYATGRIAAGVVLAAVLCLPALDAVSRRARWWFWLSVALWFSILPALVDFPRRSLRPADIAIDLAMVSTILIGSRLTRPAPLATQ